MNWKRLLAHITGSVDQELLLRNEYLATENRILRNQLKGRLRLTDPERMSLAEIGKRLGRRALEEVAQIVRPETILGWHRKLIARKFDGSKSRSMLGRPTTGPTNPIGVCFFDVAGVCLAGCGHSRRNAAELSPGRCLVGLLCWWVAAHLPPKTVVASRRAGQGATAAGNGGRAGHRGCSSPSSGCPASRATRPLHRFPSP